ncbi:MAG: transcriptional repressor LexA [Gammaproteobacteria bacterium]|nr:transcriptional repressor LexA [Gammaproteobacteria bacterium]MCW8909955.1 transcriptional repressor LexA [Gammaproteobacteria bacterium]MCW9005951.1 transcriptional repressor LexA [Gammaproteobacteria bacterium]MCW9056386.1 transcriptional repressor LexA [Gammaproteobacteria bacterium]
MNNVSMLIPKRQHPTWIKDLQQTETDAVVMLDIPLLGTITAGNPIERIEDQDRVSVPASMVKHNTYALRVSGHSMIDDNIQDGDIIIVEKRESAENGQSVVALINNEQVTLKKFYIEANGIRLQPANPDMEPIMLKNEEVQVLGIVSGIIRDFQNQG